jgi:hypothetical protein
VLIELIASLYFAGGFPGEKVLEGWKEEKDAEKEEGIEFLQHCPLIKLKVVHWAKFPPRQREIGNVAFAEGLLELFDVAVEVGDEEVEVTLRDLVSGSVLLITPRGAKFTYSEPLQISTYYGSG